jgi:hypothetical protein
MGPWEQVGSSEVPAYLDREVTPGMAFYYRVAVELRSGHRSALSNIAAAAPAGGALIAPP